MMRCILLTTALFFTCTTIQATPILASTPTEHNKLSKGISIVADRLAAKSLTDIVTLAMKLQLECQHFNSLDVCGGVKSILTVFDSRIASLPKSYDDTSVAFLVGLVEGVNDANLVTLDRINQIN